MKVRFIDDFATRWLISRPAVLAGVMSIVLFAATAYADGLTTMHGAACKPAAHDPNVTYGGALFNNGSASITVVCPLTSAWGGGTDLPAQMLTAQVHFLSNSPGSAISCTMFRQNTSGGVLQQTKPTTAIDWGTSTEKIVTFGSRQNPQFAWDVSEWNHEYVITCVLPGNSSLLNVNFWTIAR
jgi:hypothetical protein